MTPHSRPEPASDAESTFPRDATEEEIRSLPRIVDKVPFSAWAAALIGSAERFSYYAVLSIWRALRKPNNPCELHYQRGGVACNKQLTKGAGFSPNTRFRELHAA